MRMSWISGTDIHKHFLCSYAHIIFFFRIDENMDDTLANVEGAQSQLVKYLSSISSNRWLMMKIFFVLIVFLMIFVFFVAWFSVPRLIVPYLLFQKWLVSSFSMNSTSCFSYLDYVYIHHEAAYLLNILASFKNTEEISIFYFSCQYEEQEGCF